MKSTVRISMLALVLVGVQSVYAAGQGLPRYKVPFIYGIELSMEKDKDIFVYSNLFFKITLPKRVLELVRICQWGEQLPLWGTNYETPLSKLGAAVRHLRPEALGWAVIAVPSVIGLYKAYGEAKKWRITIPRVPTKQEENHTDNSMIKKV